MISLTHRQEWILILLCYTDGDREPSLVGSMTAKNMLQAFQCLYPASDSAFVSLKGLLSELKLLVDQGFIDRFLNQAGSEQTLEEYYQITEQGINALAQLGLLNLRGKKTMDLTQSHENFLMALVDVNDKCDFVVGEIMDIKAIVGYCCDHNLPLLGDVSQISEELENSGLITVGTGSAKMANGDTFVTRVFQITDSGVDHLADKRMI